ncbi:MAG: PorP/SprF family type IX secretion system membrane protein [Bacteroidia bacterium]|nr:PorP/SprF family type IX secretion system membrane protein [Bacteroidia bacterium]MCC7533499.1 PorP/SprF family type IX secretion system membrane protein [Bacteroidia bacterium]MCZ2141580.1 PorP/SprF family type IX secretion system membrane protein [Bacteroidia bacterium]
MKKILLSFFVLAGFNSVFAQQDPQLTHFFRNKLNYNPAYAGTNDDKICASLAYRTQWLGFGSKTLGLTPETFIGGIHGSVLGNKLGLGLNINSDRQGFETTLMPTFSVAYHHVFSNNHKLSGGVGVGLIQKSLDGGKLKAKDPGDALIPNSLVNGNSIDFNFGLYYKMPSLSVFRDVYFGLSSTHLNAAEVNYGPVKYTAARHYYFMAGGIYDMGNFTIEPNLFLKNAVKTSFDINVMSTINGKYLGGLTYRNVDAIAILAGMNIGSSSNNEEATSVMLSYDLTTSRLSEFSNGTFEVGIRHCFGFKIERTPPPIRPIYTPRFL